MRRLLLAFLIATSAMAADDSCGSLLIGETPVLGKTCVTVSQFNNIPTTTTVEHSVQVPAPNVRLKSIIVASTNCANCDLVIADTTCTIAAGTCSVANTASALVYANDGLVAQTFYAQAYSQYLYVVTNVPVTPTFVSGETRVYVRVTNVDPSSDDDVTVTCLWES